MSLPDDIEKLNAAVAEAEELRDDLETALVRIGEMTGENAQLRVENGRLRESIGLTLTAVSSYTHPASDISDIREALAAICSGMERDLGRKESSDAKR